MNNQSIITALSLTIAFLITSASIAWAQPIALAFVLLGMGSDWLRYVMAENSMNASYLYFVTCAAYPLAAILTIASQL